MQTETSSIFDAGTCWCCLAAPPVEGTHFCAPCKVALDVDMKNTAAAEALGVAIYDGLLDEPALARAA